MIIFQIAAIASAMTQAKRLAKAEGLSQAEAARLFVAIENRRKEKRYLRSYCKHPGDSLLHWNISKGNFRARARRLVVEKRLFPHLWWPVQNRLKIREGESLAVEYRKFSNSESESFSGKGLFFICFGASKHFWVITITLPRDFMKRPLQFARIDGIPCQILQERVAADGVRMTRANILRLVHTEGEVKFRPCWIAQSQGLSYHAVTFRGAYNGLRRKIARAQRDRVGQLTMDSQITRSMYSQLTGACALGMGEFCKRFGLTGRKSISVRELLEIMPEGTYGRDTLVRAVQG